jgi:DNA-binding CsgD family transcriptional regulator
MLVGRQAETEAVDRLLAGARDRRSSALVLRGEAGIGKSALLDYAAASADGALVLRGAGVEAESELAFAVLYQVLRPVLDRVNTLPDPQAAALRSAFALSTEAVEDRFRISVAALNLLANVAEDTPILCLIDDAQWVDEPSASVLLFTARRLEAEGIVMLFAVRDESGREFDATGLQSLTISGLDPAAARELLERDRADLAPLVRERLVEQTAGNPLALIELPATLSEDQVAGRSPLSDPLPLGAGLELAYLVRIQRLPQETQILLRVAAAEDSGELATILRAADSMGIDRRALAPAERDGLVRVVGNQLTFRHPLVRSAIYQSAPFAERQSIHRALADMHAAHGNENQDRRAWHLAAAAEGPDDEIAHRLAASADRAARRGGYTAAASALEKAARLSETDTGRTERLIAAAEAAWLAGQAERARALLLDASRVTSGPLNVDATMLLGRIEVRTGSFTEAISMLMSAAQALAATDPATAIRLLVEAEEATLYTGDIETVVQIGLLAEEITDAMPDGGHWALGRVLVGIGRQMSGRFDDAAPLLQEALPLGSSSDDLDEIVYASRVASALGDDVRALEFCNRALSLARERGAIGALPRILERVPFYEIRLGRYASARAHAAEGLRLARELGQERGVHLCELALVAAIEGREEDCRTAAAQAVERASHRRSGLLAALAAWALGLLELGLGRPEYAIAALEPVLPGGELTHPIIALFLTPDYVEAMIRAGRLDAAIATVDPFAEWAQSVEQPWALALAHHCRGLVSEPSDAEAHFAEALELHPPARPFEHARTELAFGETLRRNRKRREARDHLRAALETFESLAVAPWAERARAELRASGETARKRDPSALSQLTPQELQIARLVGDGHSNKEVAAQLFLSPRTIDYHLRKVFTKLEITSRTELIKLGIGSEQEAAAA